MGGRCPWIRVLSPLLALGLVAAACGDDDASNDGASNDDASNDVAPVDDAALSAGELPEVDGTPGGTVTVASGTGFTGYNTGLGDNLVADNVYIVSLVTPTASLTFPDGTAGLNDDLIRSITVTSTDPQIVEYALQDDVAWEDGEPIDCSDFYLAWLSQNGAAVTPDADGDGLDEPVFHAALTSGYEDISSIGCSDGGATITATFSTPYVDYGALFTSLLPAHVLEAETGVADITLVTADSPDIAAVADFWNGDWSNDDGLLAPSGAWFRIAEVDPGSITLERNPNYYGTPAYLDRIVFKTIEDPTQLAAALANGDVDVIEPGPDPDVVETIASLSGVSSQIIPGPAFDHLDFNLEHPILADRSVRQAIALCIDRDELVQRLVAPIDPQAEVLNNELIVTNQAGYEDNSASADVDFGEADTEEAQALLDAAGWEVGDDGIRVKDGERLSVRIARSDPNPRREEMVALMASQCEPVGIELLDAPDPDVFSLIDAGDYDIALFGWFASAFFTFNGGRYVTGGGQNSQGLSDPRIDDVFERINTELDVTERQALANEADRLLWDNMSSLPLFQIPYVLAHRSTISNIVPNGIGGVTWTAFQWSVE